MTQDFFGKIYSCLLLFVITACSTPTTISEARYEFCKLKSVRVKEKEKWNSSIVIRINGLNDTIFFAQEDFGNYSISLVDINRDNLDDVLISRRFSHFVRDVKGQVLRAYLNSHNSFVKLFIDEDIVNPLVYKGVLISETYSNVIKIYEIRNDSIIVSQDLKAIDAIEKSNYYLQPFIWDVSDTNCLKY